MIHDYPVIIRLFQMFSGRKILKSWPPITNHQTEYINGLKMRPLLWVEVMWLIRLGAPVSRGANAFGNCETLVPSLKKFWLPLSYFQGPLQRRRMRWVDSEVKWRLVESSCSSIILIFPGSNWSSLTEGDDFGETPEAGEWGRHLKRTTFPDSKWAKGFVW